MSKPKFSTGHVHNVWKALHTVRRERKWSVVWTVLAQRNISQPSLLENSILTKLLNVLNVRLCRRGFQVISSISSVTLDKRAHLNYHCEKMSEILNGSYFSATHQLNEPLNPWKLPGIIRKHPFCCCTFPISMSWLFKLNVCHQRKVYPCRKKKC